MLFVCIIVCNVYTNDILIIETNEIYDERKIFMKKQLQKTYIDEKTKKAIKKVAEKQNISESELVRKMIEEYLDILVFPEDEIKKGRK